MSRLWALWGGLRSRCLFKQHLRLRNKIVTDHFNRYRFILCYDDVSFAKGTFMTEMVIMPSDPSVAMLTLSEEAQIVDFHYELLIYASIFSHGEDILSKNTLNLYPKQF